MSSILLEPSFQAEFRDRLPSGRFPSGRIEMEASHLELQVEAFTPCGNGLVFQALAKVPVKQAEVGHQRWLTPMPEYLAGQPVSVQ